MAMIWRNEKNELIFDKEKFGIKVASVVAAADSPYELWWLAGVMNDAICAAMADRNCELEAEREDHEI